MENKEPLDKKIQAVFTNDGKWENAILMKDLKQTLKELKEEIGRRCDCVEKDPKRKGQCWIFDVLDKHFGSLADDTNVRENKENIGVTPSKILFSVSDIHTQGEQTTKLRSDEGETPAEELNDYMSSPAPSGHIPIERIEEIINEVLHKERKRYDGLDWGNIYKDFKELKQKLRSEAENV